MEGVLCFVNSVHQEMMNDCPSEELVVLVHLSEVDSPGHHYQRWNSQYIKMLKCFSVWYMFAYKWDSVDLTPFVCMCELNWTQVCVINMKKLWLTCLTSGI